VNIKEFLIVPPFFKGGSGGIWDAAIRKKLLAAAKITAGGGCFIFFFPGIGRKVGCALRNEMAAGAQEHKLMKWIFAVVREPADSPKYDF
jgi:hypothetical protein